MMHAGPVARGSEHLFAPPNYPGAMHDPGQGLRVADADRPYAPVVAPGYGPKTQTVYAPLAAG